MELGVAEERDFSGVRNAEPVSGKKPEKIAGIDHPDVLIFRSFFGVIFARDIGASKEEIHAPLHRREARFERAPEIVDHRLGAHLFIERVHAAPAIVVAGVGG